MHTERRDFLRTLGLGTAGLTLLPSLPAAAADLAPSLPSDDLPILQVGENIAIASTRHGRVRGFILRGIHQFRGLPYGADTSGPNRFRPPQPPTAWTGVRDALWWGPSAPQDMTNRYANAHYAFSDHWNYDEVGEDCLRLNVWTPALADGQSRPVLVWLHGGGFVNGNGIEQDGYDGENLAREGNVVFVSVNHRLGPLGFSHFAHQGAAWQGSGNVGMLDLVAALAWVRDNIEAFGGDPRQVTIIGQSGGGAKVTTLMAMPAARGLFHRAVSLSGSSLKGVDVGYAEKLGDAILAEAGLTGADVARLQEMPWPDYLRLAQRAQTRLTASGQAGGQRGGFAPVGDGVTLPTGAFFAEGGDPSVPLLVCTTFHEFSPSREDARLEAVDLPTVRDRLRDPSRRGPLAGLSDTEADVVLAAYAQRFPGRKPIELWSLIASNRRQAVATAEAWHRRGGQVHVAWFGFQPPLFDGRLRAFHCADICFWFLNTDRMYTHTGGGARPRRLARAMASALLAFMRTGRPEGTGLPAWPAFTPGEGMTLVLDDQPHVAPDPDGPARRTLPALQG